jgi:hypothetical protein
MLAANRRADGRAGSSVLALLVAAALLPAPGCSFVFIDQPPAEPALHQRIDCTTSYAAPTIDVILGVSARATS